jgi:anti-sigma factor RsiW
MTGPAHVHVSQLALERYLLGELGAEERARLEGALAECPDCRRRADETAADDRAFALRPVPPAIRALAERETAARSRTTGWRWLVAVPTAVAAAAIAVALWTGGPAPARDDRPPGIDARGSAATTRLKGSAATAPAIDLGFYVSRGGAKSLGKPGERLTAGDRIEFWYDAPAAPAFALVGIDGRGAVTAYLPGPGQGSSALAGGRGASLGAAIELDDAKGAERFFLCVGPAAADPAAVTAAARSLVEARADVAVVDRLPVACDQASVWIRKE